MTEPDGPSAMPGLDVLRARLDELARGGSMPSVLIVEVAAFAGLSSIDVPGAHAAVAEVGRRLGRLIRGRDVLGFEAPARFVLGCASLSPEQAGGLMERIRGGAAMPVEIGGEAVSLVVDMGCAFWTDGASGASLLDDAAADLGRARPES